MRTVTPGTLVIDHLAALESDGYSKRSGLTALDFTLSLLRDGIPAALPVSIVEIGATGEYKVSFTPTVEGVWSLEVLVDFNKDLWRSEVVAATELMDMSEIINRIAGLLHYNAILDNHAYDANGQLLSARLRVFDSAANVPNTPGGAETTGLTQQYSIESEYQGVNRNTRYALKRVL